MTTSAGRKLREQFVKVAPGLAMPPEVMVSDEVNGYAVEVVVIPNEGRLVAKEVRVRQLDGGPPVTGEAIRGVPVAALTKMAAARVVEYEEDHQPGGVVTSMSPRWLTPETAARIRAGRGPTDEALGWVAHLYRIALLMGEPPTKAVQTTLEIPRSTAGRWVALARDSGHLGPAEGAGKAGG